MQTIMSGVLAGCVWMCAAAHAETVKVSPEEGQLEAALENVSEGDVIQLAPGEYEGSISLPDGVELVGAEAGGSVIIGDEFSVINVTGDRVVIRDLEIRASEGVRRGVNAMSSVRIENCVFVEIEEAVALMGAPLTDVLDCTFIDCAIGVRAIGWACPTVWGCTFRGGSMGVFAMDSAPYIGDCTFIENGTGIMAAGDFRRLMVRNSVFVDAKEAAIRAQGGDIMGFSGITNCVFHGCDTVLQGTGGHAGYVRSSVLSACGDTPFVLADGAAFDHEANGVVVQDLDVEVDKSGSVSLGGLAAVEIEPETLPADFETEEIVGPTGIAGAGLPVRFRETPYVANETREQYAYLRFHELQMVMQSTGDVDGVPMDYMDVRENGKERTVQFNVVRYYGRF